MNGFQITPYLQELQAYAGQSDNYTSSVSALKKYLRIDVGRSQTERVTKHYGKALEDSELSLKVAQEKSVEEIKAKVKESGNVYSMLDGAMLQTREGKNGNDWKEVKVGRIFTDKDLYEVDKHHNWIAHSTYVAHLGDCHSFLEKFEPLNDILESLDERLIFIADGASWIWKWVRESYPNATQILDFYHGVEHLAKFGKIYFKDKQILDNWLAKQKIDLLNDRIEKVIRDIETLNSKYSTVQEAKEKLLTYLNNNQGRMLYKTYTDRGLKIGSGAIESAHRTVIQKRLKQSGQRWTLSGAQKVINLRLMMMNQQWDSVIELIKHEEQLKYVKYG